MSEKCRITNECPLNRDKAGQVSRGERAGVLQMRRNDEGHKVQLDWKKPSRQVECVFSHEMTCCIFGKPVFLTAGRLYVRK